MKIWFPVITGRSGTDTWTRRLADALQRRGIATEVTWFSTHHQFAPFLLRKIPPPRETTLIHANSWNGFAFKRAGIPLIVTEHLNVLDPLYRPYKNLAQHIYHETLVRRFVMASFREASTITVVSHFTASGLVRNFGIRSAQVIYNWIDTDAFLPRDYKPGAENRPFRLLFMGNLSRRKGADMLVPIMKDLGPGFELRFTSGLKRLNTKHSAQNMVPLGRLTEDSELVEVYNSCDALLFPSRFEGLPQVALEAMACGKPVIASRTASLPEVVEDGVTGILCPPDDVQVFANACRKLANNPDIVQMYGQAARRRVEDLFSEERIIPQCTALYEKLAHVDR